MINITCKMPIEKEPWNIPFAQRVHTVLSAANSGKKVALMLYRCADTSTFRYRCYNVYQATSEGSSWQSMYFFLPEIETVEKLLSSCNLLILTRIKWSYALNALVMKAKKMHIPVLFDVDDLICNIKYLPLLTNTLNVHFGSEVDYDFWFAYISRHEAAAAMADGFITTNPYLGEKLSERFGKPYQIIVNSLNKEQLRVSELCRNAKNGKRNKKPYTIGYFSGTPSHINDFRVVYQEIIALLNDYPEMQLQVVGFMEFPKEMQPLIQKKRVTFVPLVDFLELQRLIAQVDVNIVPLVNNAFTNCKSELKFFEAAAVDTVTVATPTYTYKHSIREGDTGFLCEQGQWYNTILNLYKNPELSAQIAKKAESYCLDAYAGETFKNRICATYDFFLK